MPDEKTTGRNAHDVVLDKHEQNLREQLARTTDEACRVAIEAELNNCAALRHIQKIDEKIKNAPPKEAAYYRFLEKLKTLQKRRASGEMSKAEAFYMISQLILPNAISSAERLMKEVAPYLWDLKELAQENEGVRRESPDEEYGAALERADAIRPDIEKLDQAIHRLVAGEFRSYGEQEAATLYEGNVDEFIRLYDEGRRIHDCPPKSILPPGTQ